MRVRKTYCFGCSEGIVDPYHHPQSGLSSGDDSLTVSVPKNFALFEDVESKKRVKFGGSYFIISSGVIFRVKYGGHIS